MSIIANNLLQGDEGYNIARSLRFRSSASAYLNRTPSTGNRKTWTWSGWVKRGQLGVRQSLLYCVTGTTDSTFLILGFDASERFEVSGYITQFRTSTAVYRDPSAWYHVVVAFDSTQATASNRLRVYINNTEITAWTTNNAFTQNTDYGINQNTNHQIGGGGYLPFDGYLTEVNFIDGQALTPSSFGETDSVTGVWKPKKYAGTYGTNGFYLPFTDVATTSGSNAGLGKDFSGNGNYWNTNNISVTAGTTYDSMKDVPTLTSATAANYCTWNPLHWRGSANVPTNGNLTTASTGTSVSILSTIPMTTGKFYAEFTVSSNAYPRVGVTDVTETDANMQGSKTISWGGSNGAGAGEVWVNGSKTGYTQTAYLATDTIGIAYDASTRQVWFSKNGTWQNFASTGADPATGTNPVATLGGSDLVLFGARTESSAITANFGQRPFAFSAPTGFKPLNTYNLP